MYDFYERPYTGRVYGKIRLRNSNQRRTIKQKI